jgi:hypothetical protein
MTALYTVTEARRNLALILDRVAREGVVRIKRRDGATFVIKLEQNTVSPLDIEGIPMDLSRDEILEFVHDGRRFSKLD